MDLHGERRLEQQHGQEHREDQVWVGLHYVGVGMDLWVLEGQEPEENADNEQDHGVGEAEIKTLYDPSCES